MRETKTVLNAIQHNMSREKYLILDQQSDLKHEFYQGEVFAMSGGTFNHATIARNILAQLFAQLRGSPCQPMNSDMRIHTPAGLDTYPDISVYCGEPELTDNQCSLLNPVIIIEVLSPSTRSYDRGDKFMLYRSISVLLDYVLVDSEQVLVEHYRRTENNEWILHEYRDVQESVYLQSIKDHLLLIDMYESVKFP
ncbi:Uma2 family endonuclease [Thioflexithrix psekupsensis]|jgi:Uma2 family endonuclease|uniref:Putative restriction endonuclease domain-containing protein n=1 Tax=Thioflexithrix psekupsensis TaxID=1570016 RepID=A0A251XCC1_9GAMM|nr:Uma2 family endonuclease [Thioflexithrix psekupsensis]OUD15696.1 hypothetical protein TPSD3_04065 [Thioflexithrix psekupsensis]